MEYRGYYGVVWVVVKMTMEVERVKRREKRGRKKEGK
jgi:hypothetical protein